MVFKKLYLVVVKSSTNRADTTLQHLQATLGFRKDMGEKNTVLKEKQATPSCVKLSSIRLSQAENGQWASTLYILWLIELI